MPNPIRQLSEYFDDAQSLDLAAFIERHGPAFFVHHGPVGKLHMKEGLDKTVSPDSATTSPGIPFDPKSDFLVFETRPKATTADGDDRIWLGRSEDNDMLIEDESISAVHAFIRIEADRYYLQDMSSRNGSFVNGDPVPAQGIGDAVEIPSGSRVRFGTVKMNFLQVAEFITLIQRLMG